jgi:hypothetical protein
MRDHSSQLELDLSRNAADRLRKWVLDTAMRCDVVDLPSDKQYSILMSCLMSELTLLWKFLGVKPADAGRIVAELYREADAHLEARSQQVK